jgi:hypothetical protein
MLKSLRHSYTKTLQLFKIKEMDIQLTKHSFYIRLLHISTSMEKLSEKISIFYRFDYICVTLSVAILLDILRTPNILKATSLITYSEGCSLNICDKMDFDLFFIVFKTHRANRAKILLALISKIQSDWNTLHITRPLQYIEELYVKGDSILIRELLELIC